MTKRTPPFSPEVRERAVRLVLAVGEWQRLRRGLTAPRAWSRYGGRVLPRRPQGHDQQHEPAGAGGRICGGDSTTSSSRPGRRWRPRCWRASAPFTRSRWGSGAILRSTAGRCGASEVGPSSTSSMPGCSTTQGACRPPPTWRARSATPSGTGRGWSCSSMTAGWRWRPTWWSERSARAC